MFCPFAFTPGSAPDDAEESIEYGLQYHSSLGDYEESREWNEIRLPTLRMRKYHDDKDLEVRAVVSSLENLRHPIKLMRYSELFKIGRFPRYDEDFNFEMLSESTNRSCVAISHRWSIDFNKTGSRDDAKWLAQNWHNVKLPEGLEDPLLFYDYMSLPQTIGKITGVDVADDGNASVLTPDLALTFKAGLECVDLLFSQRAIVVPTTNYLFRYWCYLEFFIMTYNYSKICQDDFIELLPYDLRIIDGVLHKLRNEIMLPNCRTFDLLQAIADVGTITSLDNDHRSHVMDAVYAMVVGSVDQETLSGYFQRIVIIRETVVDLIKTRVRQCTLTVATDRKWLESVMERYLKRPELPVICRISLEERLRWKDKCCRIMGIKDDDDDGGGGGILSSLNNLQHPVKLIPWSVVKELKRFPNYEEDFVFVPLSTETYSKCLVISHQRSIDGGGRQEAKWLFDNWANVQLPEHLTDPLLFYEWTSLPHALGDGSHLSEEQALARAQTFKAGAVCFSFLFVQRGLTIPTLSLGQAGNDAN